MDKLQHNRELVSALADGHLRGDEFACAVEVTVSTLPMVDNRSTAGSYFGAGILSSSSNRPNSLRSSAKSMLEGSVPMIGTPAALSGKARFRGVWPPN